MTTKMMLRTCGPDMTSHGGFVWPTEGLVEAPDWNPDPVCGGGLHGLLDGQGDAQLLDWNSDTVWLVCEVDEDQLVDLRCKVKVPSATVVYCGDRDGALAALRAAGVTQPLPGDTATAGYWGTATAGYGGTATAGDEGTAAAGERGTATAGYGGTATAGDEGTAAAGNWGTAVAGNGGTAAAGNRGTATAGNGGTAVAGNWGTATVGNRGTATAGDRGTAVAGDGGTVVLSWRNGNRRRLVVGYVGEDGIEPDVPYRLDNNGRLVAADGEVAA